MSRPRYELQRITDFETLLLGLVVLIFDHKKGKPHGWYPDPKLAHTELVRLNAGGD